MEKTINITISLEEYTRLVIAKHDFEAVKNAIANNDDNYIDTIATTLLKKLCGIEKGDKK